MPRKRQPEPDKPPSKRKAKDPPRYLPAVIEAEFSDKDQKPPKGSAKQKRARTDEKDKKAEGKAKPIWEYRDPKTIEIDPEWPELLVAHMSNGMSFDSFAGHPRVRIARSTLYELTDTKRGDPLQKDFANAKEVGEVACLYWWEYQGQQGLWGGADFKPPMWIYNMKCRFRENWHDRFENLTDPAQLVSAAIQQFHEMQNVMAGPEPAKTP
jgi:hypothetical protein